MNQRRPEGHGPRRHPDRERDVAGALGDVLDREARLAGVVVNIELVKPDGDKLRRANAWSPLVEDGTVLFGPGQKELIDAMLAVPGDATQWDLVDAGGLCVRGFPRVAPESSRLTEFEHQPTRAAGYATRSSSTVVEDMPTPSTLMPSPGRYGSPGGRLKNAVRRAAGYAIKPRSSR